MYRIQAGLALALIGTIVMAEPMSLTYFKPKVMPVLVAVNTRGRVTEVLPSTALAPKFQRLLTENLAGWIKGPAKVKGRAVDSQFIVNVAMRTTKLTDGDYAVSFAYVSSLPSPYGGAAHWVWKNGVQLALVSDADSNRWRRISPPRLLLPPPPPHWQHYEPMPAYRATFRSMAPAPAPWSHH